MAIREGRWDCSSCGSTRIYGRHVDCPGCGRPRPGGVRFYLADGEPVVTSAAQLRDARAGPDWICRHCHATSRASFATCGGCGKAREGNDTQRVIEYHWGKPQGGGGLAAPQPEWDYLARLRSPGMRLLLKVVMWLGAAGLLVVGLASALLMYHERGQIVPARVVSLTWERIVWFRDPHVVEGEGWTLPDSAEVLGQERRLQRTERRVVRVDTTWHSVPLYNRVREGVDTVERTVQDQVQTGTITVVCGTRDLGNGYFEDVECSEPVYETVTRQVREVVPRYVSVPAGTDRRMRLHEVHGDVPVYGTWYTYRAREWRPERVSAMGPLGTARVWPALPSDTARETERHEVLLAQVHAAREGMVWRTVDTWEVFASYRVGQPIALRIGRGSQGRDTDLLPRDSLPACRRWHRGRGQPPPDSMGCTVRAKAP